MPSHSEGPGIWLSVWRFFLIHCLYERAAKVLASLRRLAWTFAARIGDKDQIRLTRSNYWNTLKTQHLIQSQFLREDQTIQVIDNEMDTFD